MNMKILFSRLVMTLTMYLNNVPWMMWSRLMMRMRTLKQWVMSQKRSQEMILMNNSWSFNQKENVALFFGLSMVLYYTEDTLGIRLNYKNQIKITSNRHHYIHPSDFFFLKYYWNWKLNDMLSKLLMIDHETDEIVNVLSGLRCHHWHWY